MPFRLPRLLGGALTREQILKAQQILQALEGRGRLQPGRPPAPAPPPRWGQELRGEVPEVQGLPTVSTAPPPLPGPDVRLQAALSRLSRPPEPAEETIRRLSQGSLIAGDPADLVAPDPPRPDPRQLPLMELPETTQPFVVETAGARTVHNQPLIPLLPMAIDDEEIRRALSREPLAELPSLDPRATDALLQNPEPGQLFNPPLDVMARPPAPTGPAGQLRMEARPATEELVLPPWASQEPFEVPTGQTELFTRPLHRLPEAQQIPPQPPLDRSWDDATATLSAAAFRDKELKALLGLKKQPRPTDENVPGAEPQMDDLADLVTRQDKPFREQRTTDALIDRDIRQDARLAQQDPELSEYTPEQAAKRLRALEAAERKTFPSSLPRRPRRRLGHDLSDAAVAGTDRKVIWRTDPETGERVSDLATVVSPLRRALLKIANRVARTLTPDEQKALNAYMAVEGFGPGRRLLGDDGEPAYPGQTVIEPVSTGVAELDKLPPDLHRKTLGSAGAEPTAGQMRAILDDPTLSEGQKNVRAQKRWFSKYGAKTMPRHDQMVIASIERTFADQPTLVNQLLDRYTALARQLTTPAERLSLAKHILESVRAYRRVEARGQATPGWPTGATVRYYPSDLGANVPDPLKAPSLFRVIDQAIGDVWSMKAPLQSTSDWAMIRHLTDTGAWESGGRPLSELDRAALAGIDADLASTNPWVGIQEPGDAFTTAPERVTLKGTGISAQSVDGVQPGLPTAIEGHATVPPIGIPGDPVRLPDGRLGRIVSVSDAPSVEQGAALRFQEGQYGPSIESQADSSFGAPFSYKYPEGREKLTPIVRVEIGDFGGGRPRLRPTRGPWRGTGEIVQVPQDQIRNLATKRRGMRAADVQTLRAEIAANEPPVRPTDADMRRMPSSELARRLPSAEERKANLDAGRPAAGLHGHELTRGIELVDDAGMRPFRGELGFLSNFQPGEPVVLDGVTYATVEQAFQAAKFPPDQRARFQAMTPSQAKAAGKGRSLRTPEGIALMEDLVRQKFKPGSAAAQRLIATKDEPLGEVNTWKDAFWGVPKGGRGFNHLGKILTTIRAELQGGQRARGAWRMHQALFGKKGAALGTLLGAAGLSQLAALGQEDQEDQGIWGRQLPELEGVEPQGAGFFSRALGRTLRALPSDVLEGIRQEQMAPVRKQSTQSGWSQFKDKFIGEHEYIEDIGRSAERNLRKAGRVVHEAVLDMLPHRQIPANVRGGMGKAHQSGARVGEVIATMGPDLMDRTRAYLNTIGYEREFNLVERKIAEAESQYAALLAKGEVSQANTVYKSVADMRKALAEHTVVPRNLTRNQVIAERQKILAALTRKERHQVLTGARVIFEEIQKAVDELHQEGGIDPAIYAEWKQAGPEYFPLHRLMTIYDPAKQERIKPLFLGAPAGQPAARVRLGIAHSTLLDPEIRGSKLVNVDPLEGVAHILEGLHNDIGRLRVGKNVIQSLFAVQDQIDPQYQAVVRKSWEDEPVPDGYGKVAWLDQNIPQYYLVNKDLANAFSALEAAEIVDAVKFASAMRGTYHQFAATANLRFMAKQMVIDPMAMALLTPFDKYSGRQWGPAIRALGTYARGWAALYGDQLAELLGVRAPQWIKNYQQEVAQSGFDASGAGAQPLGVRGSLFRDVVGPRESEFRKSTHKVQRGYRFALEWIQRRGLEPNERAVKYAAFKQLRTQGYSHTEAAAATRAYGGSPDFNKWGWWTRKHGKNNFMFIGPTISGMHRVARRAHESPERMMEFVLAATLAERALDAWNAQYEDEHGVSPLSKTDRRIRAGNFLLVDPNSKPQILSNGDIRWPLLKLPKPPELIALQAPIQALKFAMEDKDYTALDALAHNLEQWIPGGGSLSGDSTWDLASSIGGRLISGVNPAWRFLPEQLSGEGGWNYTVGAPIVGSRTQGKIPEMQFTPYTDPVIRAASRQIGEAVPNAPEMLRSPDRLQHLVNTFFPGLGEIILGVGRPFVEPTPQQRLGLESESERFIHTPVIGPISRTFYDPGTQNQQRSDDLKTLFAAADETGTARETINRLITTGNVEEYQRVSPELWTQALANPAVATLQRQLSEINTVRERLLVAPDYSPAQRRQALTELWAQEQALLSRLSTMLQP